MPRFSLSKVDKYRNEQSKSDKDIIDIKFPSELEPKDLLIFIVEDDPHFLQLLNTHFSKLTLDAGSDSYRFKVKNFATGKSCIEALALNPDLILLNYYLNDSLTNTLSGRETLDQLIEINPNQKIIILNELEEKLRGAFVENGLRDFIIKDKNGLQELNKTISEILNS